jgi:hypothetical protein
MKFFSIPILVAVFIMPTVSQAKQATPRPNDIPIELVRETEFVVKMMDVFDNSGKKIKGPVELDSFRNEKKVFIFKTADGKLQKISAKKISKIVFSRLRHGVLTGKPSSLRVNAWNGKTRNFASNFAELKIKDGDLYLGQNEFLSHFDGADTLRAEGDEWSEKLHNFWKKTKKESPKVFSTDFAFKNGHGYMSRKMAAVYCRTCLKVEVLNLKINSKKETVSIRCKDVFYDKYNE